MWIWVISAVFVAQFLALMATDTSPTFAKRVNETGGGSDRIVGGTDFPIDKVPHQVFIRIIMKCVSKGGIDRRCATSTFCGGSIIHQRFILTAAHCLFDDRKLVTINGTDIRLPAENFFVRVGSANKNSGGQLIQGNRTIVHKQYHNDNLDVDFAMIMLRDSIKFGSGGKAPQLIQVPKKSEWKAKWDGGPCLVSGWGDTIKKEYWQRSMGPPTKRSERAQKYPLLLQGAEMKVLPNNEECKAILGNFSDPAQRHPDDVDDIHKSAKELNEYNICAETIDGKGNEDACQGDSGGPLTCKEKSGKPFLLGTVKDGWGCASGVPGGYMRAPRLRVWISQFVRKYSPNDLGPFK